MLLQMTLFYSYLWLSINVFYCVYVVYIHTHTHTHHIFFTHSSVYGHLSCFHAFAFVNNTAVSIGVHLSFWNIVLSGYIPRSGIAGWMDDLLIRFLIPSSSGWLWQRSGPFSLMGIWQLLVSSEELWGSTASKHGWLFKSLSVVQLLDLTGLQWWLM